MQRIGILGVAHHRQEFIHLGLQRLHLGVEIHPLRCHVLDFGSPICNVPSVFRSRTSWLLNFVKWNISMIEVRAKPLLDPAPQN